MTPENKIIKKQDFLEIHVKKPALKNKANLVVIKLLSKYLNVPQTSIKIKGLRSKTKYIEINNG